jgi:hypothetical protein
MAKKSVLREMSSTIAHIQHLRVEGRKEKNKTKQKDEGRKPMTEF